MRVLFIVPYVPNLIRVRPYNLIRHLSARGHEVTILTLWSTERERADAEALKQHCHRVVALPLPRWRPLWNCLRALPTPVPLQAVYCWSPSLAQEIADRLSPIAYRSSPSAIGDQPSAISHPPSAISHQPYDIVHVEHLRGARYGLNIQYPISSPQPPTSNLQPPVIWDSVDCISLLFEQALQMGPSLGSRLKAWLDLERTRRYEGWLVRQFDRVLVTSPTDKEALEELAASRKSQVAGHMSSATDKMQLATLNPEPETITVLPNGVDLNYFSPMDVPRSPATLVLTGKMSYHANVAAALYLVREIMPRVWAQRPDAKLCIVGKDPPKEITKLKAQISNIQYPISNPSQPPPAIRHQPSAISHQPIAVTGTVSDIRPYLAQATVAVCPVLYSAGIQNKVLEAMAMGTPVVATPQSCAALEVTNGENILIAEKPEEFAQRVLELLDDAEFRERIGRNGRRYVEEHHDWRDVAQRLEEIYQEVLEKCHCEACFPPSSS